eukprot:CAMPEP_0197941130 /NCGR_PEP_ID=MMETSP1439-20131203/122314_1 /TAXON_ID=66791 /ORGANISM="Gonyaulax spinifera, Strain CCMP409" /LENGTH=251 /DNA_ID=CAMNT_0043564317 /DNA_START=233 /DNA_END=991 /DNA_ORIENTATION=+
MVHESQAQAAGSKLLGKSWDEVQGLADPDVGQGRKPCQAQGVSSQEGVDGVHLQTDCSARCWVRPAQPARQAYSRVANKGPELRPRVRSPGGAAIHGGLDKLGLAVRGHLEPLADAGPEELMARSSDPASPGRAWASTKSSSMPIFLWKLMAAGPIQAAAAAPPPAGHQLEELRRQSQHRALLHQAEECLLTPLLLGPLRQHDGVCKTHDVQRNAALHALIEESPGPLRAARLPPGPDERGDVLGVRIAAA